MFTFIEAVSGTVFDMINAAYYDKPLMFIKVVSDTALDMINAVYHDKPLIFIKAVPGTVLDKINAVYHDKPLISIKAVSDTVFDMINAAYYDKPLIFTFDIYYKFEFITAVYGTVLDIQKLQKGDMMERCEVEQCLLTSKILFEILCDYLLLWHGAMVLQRNDQRVSRNIN